MSQNESVVQPESTIPLNLTTENFWKTFEYAVSQKDSLWLLVSTGLIFLMIPGLALFYSSLVKKVNALRIFTAIFMAFSVVCIQWFLFGYSLVFAQNSGSNFIGDFEHILLYDVGKNPNTIATTVPSSIFMLFQSFFAAITPCLIFGSVADKTTVSSFVVISLFWTTFVYDFVAYWTWNKRGWLNSLGAVDFAGGGPVHIASGFAALAYSLAIGPAKIKEAAKRSKETTINLSEMLIGTGLLWFGWFGFNGGSEDAFNARTINSIATTNLSACIAGITWVAIEGLFIRRASFEAFCTGAVAGLVAITPACGYVDMASSLLIGFSASVVCFVASRLMKLCSRKLQDTCDVFAVHGIGGVVGSLLTGFLAKNSIVLMGNDSSINGGAIDGNWMLLLYQFIAVISIASWSFVITFLLVIIYRILPFVKLRHDLKDLDLSIEPDEPNNKMESEEMVVFNRIRRPSKIAPMPENNPTSYSPSPRALPVSNTLRQKIELQNKITILSTNQSSV